MQIERNLWLGGYRPQISVLSALCPQLNLLKPLSPKKIPGYANADQGWALVNNAMTLRTPQNAENLLIFPVKISFSMTHFFWS
jgi:hypothetical protein